jgi:ATP-binding cassette subfamily B protein RaxB
VTTIQKTLTTGVVQALVDALMVAGTAAMMGVYSPRCWACRSRPPCCTAGLRWAVFRRCAAASAEEIIHAAKQQTHFLETASGIQSVRLFGRGDQRRAGWMNMLADQFNAGLRVQRVHVGHETGADAAVRARARARRSGSRRAWCSRAGSRSACCSRTWPTRSCSRPASAR